jgi:hypothetical protein
MGKTKLEIKMAVTRRGDRRKGIRRQSGRRKGDIGKIKIEGERDNEQGVTIRHEAVPPKKASSVWNWHEEFAAQWSQSFISKKRKKIRKMTRKQERNDS